MPFNAQHDVRCDTQIRTSPSATLADPHRSACAANVHTHRGVARLRIPRSARRGSASRPPLLRRISTHQCSVNPAQTCPLPVPHIAHQAHRGGVPPNAGSTAPAKTGNGAQCFQPRAHRAPQFGVRHDGRSVASGAVGQPGDEGRPAPASANAAHRGSVQITRVSGDGGPSNASRNCSDSADEGRSPPGSLDLQAHRGGIGRTTESTLAGFARAIEAWCHHVGARHPSHRRWRSCRSRTIARSAPSSAWTRCRLPPDPEFPYVGKFITDLTLTQVKTVQCGYEALPATRRRRWWPAR